MHFYDFGHPKRTLATKNEIGGPCRKPYIYVTFRVDFTRSTGGKISVAGGKWVLNGNSVIFFVLDRSVWSWEAQKPQYSYSNSKVSSSGRPGTPPNHEGRSNGLS